VTVGKYSSIFLHHSLLTLSHLCNFTPRALHALLVWGFRLSNARILRLAVDPSTLLRRRFLGPDTPEVPRFRCAGGSPPPPRPLNILRHRKARRFPPSSPADLRRCPGPCICSIITRGMSTLAFPGSSACIYTEVPWVKDGLRRFRVGGSLGEGYP